MNTKKELQEAITSNPLSFLEEFFPNGELKGDEYEMGNIKGDAGDSLKFNIKKGTWADFATDSTGKGFISLYAEKIGKDWTQALHQLWEIKKTVEQGMSRPPKDNLFPKELSGQQFWTYKAGDGWPVLYVQRIDQGIGRKIFIPRTWDKQLGWVKKAPSKDRPLYNLPKVLASDSILLVEGEKAADAAQKFCGGMAATTWMNGAMAVKRAAWSPLKGKDVVLWPDADKTGIAAMENIAEIISGAAKRIRIIDVSDLPEKHDAADMGFSQAEFKTWITGRLSDVEIVPKETTQPELPIGGVDDSTLGIPMEKRVSDALEEAGTHKEAVEAALQGNSDYPLMTTLKNMKLTFTANGAPHSNFNNIFRMIEGFFPNDFWFDTFRNRGMTTFKDLKHPVPITKEKESHLLGTLQGLGFPRLGRETVSDALDAYIKGYRERNSMEEWLKGLFWDRRDRIGDFFQDYMGAENSEYSKAVSRNFWIAMAARIVRPGSKVDTMVIIEGPQGIRKSSFLKAISGAPYFAALTGFMSDTMAVKGEGKIIVELPEIEALGRSKMDQVKAFLTTETDTLVRKYDRESSELKRTALYVGTTNRRIYLDDPTGNRRFWPIRAKMADIEGLEKDREQLFAEAYYRYMKGEMWWEMPAGTDEEIGQRNRTDPWYISLLSHARGEYNMGRTVLNLASAARATLGLEIKDMNPQVSGRIEETLLAIGYERTETEGGLRFIWTKDASP